MYFFMSTGSCSFVSSKGISKQEFHNFKKYKMKAIFKKVAILFSLIMMLSIYYADGSNIDVYTCQNGTATITDSLGTTWTVYPGNPTSATIDSPSSITTTITGLTTVGIYTFWRTGSGVSDTFNIHVQVAAPTPALSLAGGCMGSDSLLLEGLTAATQVSWYFNGILIDTLPFPASTIAGGNGAGTALNQFEEPTGAFVDASGNLYTTDIGNDRILMFPAGSTSATNGVIVAGGNGFGNGPTQLGNPMGVYLDLSGNIFVADVYNGRIQKFPAGSTQSTNGVTVGSIAVPTSLYVDASDNVYATDQNNNQVVKFTPGSTTGVVVAGGNGQGSAANQLFQPNSVYLDGAGNIYVCDQNNNRIQKFPAGSTSVTNGVTVAGGNGQGSAANQFYIPDGVFVDAAGNIYVADYDNNRVQKFPASSTSATNGVTVAGGNGPGSAVNQLYGPDWIYVDGAGTMYITDYWNNRIQKWTASAIDSFYTPTQPGNYAATYTLNTGCTSLLSDSVLVYICSPDSTVWPGDADANHVVNNADLFPIGLGYDTTGPVRAVQGIVWQGDIATNWADTLPGYNPTINFKHADCNGDGIINSADTVAIMANFSLTHNKTGPILSPWRNGIPAIKAVVTPDTAYTGDTLTVTFVLGDTNTTVNNFYGIAFTYNFDPMVMDSTYAPTMGFLPTSWIGTPSQKISINKIFTTTGQIQAAVTRINHTGVSGQGAIAVASFRITTDNISGKNYHYYTNIGSITDVTLIDQHGATIPLNAGADTTTVGFIPNGIREITTETLHIRPNPAHDKVLVSAGNTIREISLTNIIGQQVMDNNTANSKSVSIDVSGIDSGVYFVHVRTEQGTGIAKLIIEK
jgi:sugar lactone lactonase YvrE